MTTFRSLALAACAPLCFAVLAACEIPRVDFDGPAEPVVETPFDPGAWQTTRAPYLIGDGSIAVYFTRPGVSDETGEDPEVDDDVAALFATATERIDLCLFEFNRPVLVDATLDALGRGVTVRFAGDGDEMEDLGYAELVDAGLELSVRKPADRIMHNKFAVVDDQWVVSGSMNFSENGVLKNNNNVVMLHSATLAETYVREFEQMYVDKVFGRQKAVVPDKPIVELADQKIEARFSPKDDMVGTMLDALDTADKRVFFMIFSFTHPDISQKLIDLHNAGVEVVGVFDESQGRGRYSVDEALAAAGIPVYIDGNEHTSGFAGGKLHHKVMMIDPATDSEPITVTGSYNWSNAASEYNDENVVLMRGADLAAPYVEEFCRVLAVATPHPDFKGEAVDPCANLVTPIRINEMLPNPDGADGPNEFVEIVNAGTAGVNLDGWRIGDQLDSSRHVFEALWLPPGAAVVVWSGPDPDGGERLVASSGALSLNNNAEEIALFGADGSVVDAAAWRDAPSGVSFNRATDGGTDGAFVLHETLSDTLSSSPGLTAGGEPWATGVPIPLVAINEVMPNPEGPDTDEEYVELVAISEVALDLAGWTLSDAVSVRHVFPEGATLLPHQAVVIYSGGVHADVPNVVIASTGALGLNNTGDTLVLAKADGTVVDAVAWTASESGMALNRVVDGGPSAELVPHVHHGGTSSPGFTATGQFWTPTGPPAAVVVNEWLPNPTGSDADQEYVELVNPNPYAVGLGGWTIGDAIEVRHTFPTEAFIPAGGVVVIFDGGDHAGVPGAVLASTGTLSLNNTDDSLTLTAPGGVTVSTVSWSGSTEGVSYNRSPDGAADGEVVLHTALSTLSTSPGLRADGTAW
ncbi:MAG: hypothetical protein EP329_00315 [Deltaproteobacteria bacterium]|nr:MAG: hypothetical protein EP329_00315 [Deltaproteobacteria bacterium]